MVAFTVFGGVGFVLALAVALAVARSAVVALAIGGIGPILVAGWLTLMRLNQPAQQPHDSSEYFGVWVSPIMAVGFGFNLLGWLVGTAVGYGLRRARAARRDRKAVSSFSNL